MDKREILLQSIVRHLGAVIIPLWVDEKPYRPGMYNNYDEENSRAMYDHHIGEVRSHRKFMEEACSKIMKDIS